MRISDITPREDNPRTITQSKFDKLCSSIKEFPKMMELRPIVIGSDGVILGGNMRYQALIKLGYDVLPDGWVKVADSLTEEEQRRFVIEDNVPFGEWDYDLLANEWDDLDLSDLGIDIPNVLDDADEDLAVEDDVKSCEVTIVFDSSDEVERFIGAYGSIIEDEFGCKIK